MAGQPVYLTGLPHSIGQPRQLSFYEAIDETTASRTRVLSAISAAGRDARLPEVKLSELNTWIDVAAVTDSAENVGQGSFSSLCTVVKVADALEDARIEKWIKLAAYSMLQHRNINCPKQRVMKLEGLNILTEDLQHRLFTAAAHKPSHFYSLVHLLPPLHHAALIAAAITPTKTLQLQFSCRTLPRAPCQKLAVLKAVAALPASPASVLSLHVVDYQGDQRDCSSAPSYLETAQHLSTALYHHSSLTSLYISIRGIDATSAKLFLPAVASLSCLQSLHLGSKDSGFSYGTMTMLQTFRGMPQLQALTLFLNASSPSPDPESLKRQRDAAAPPPCCLTTALSPATSLTSLHLHIRKFGPLGRNFVASGPLFLPHLVQLTAAFKDSLTLTTAFLSQLQTDSPITSLTLTGELPSHLRTPEASIKAAQQFFSRLASFTQLTVLDAVLPMEGVIVPDVTTARAPPTLAAFVHLQELSLVVEVPVVLQAMPILAAALTALSHLRMRFCEPFHRRDAEVPWPAAWQHIASHICQLPLQHLELYMLERLDTGRGVAALRPLAQLTALRTSAWHLMANTGDCDALAGMTRMRQLSLDGFHHRHRRDRVPDAAAVRVLLGLSSLTSLTLRAQSVEFDEALADAWAVHPPEAAWPALQELSLDAGHPMPEAEDLVRCATKLPALTMLEVKLLHGEPSRDRAWEDCFTDMNVCDDGGGGSGEDGYDDSGENFCDDSSDDSGDDGNDIGEDSGDNGDDSNDSGDDSGEPNHGNGEGSGDNGDDSNGSGDDSGEPNHGNGNGVARASAAGIREMNDTLEGLAAAAGLELTLLWPDSCRLQLFESYEPM